MTAFWPEVAADLRKLNAKARVVLDHRLREIDKALPRPEHSTGCRGVADVLGDTRCRCSPEWRRGAHTAE